MNQWRSYGRAQALPTDLPKPHPRAIVYRCTLPCLASSPGLSQCRECRGDKAAHCLVPDPTPKRGWGLGTRL